MGDTVLDLKNMGTDEMEKGKYSGSLESYEKAENCYRKAIDRFDDSTATALKVVVLSNLAAALLEQDRFDAAKEQCVAALAIDPEHKKSKHRLDRAQRKEPSIFYAERLEREEAARREKHEQHEQDEEEKEKERKTAKLDWTDEVATEDMGSTEEDVGLQRTATARHRSLYEILKITPQTATAADIKKQMRSLCRKFHPDTRKTHDDDDGYTDADADREFRLVMSAHNVLSDTEMKAGYDRALEYCDMQKLGEISSSGSTHPYTEYEEWKEMEEYLRRLREQQRKTEQRNRTTKQVWAGIFAILVVGLAIGATFFADSKVLWGSSTLGQVPSASAKKNKNPLIPGFTIVEPATGLKLQRFGGIDSSSAGIEVVLAIDVGLLEWSSKLVQKSTDDESGYTVLDMPTMPAELTFFANGSIEMGSQDVVSDAVKVTDIMRLLGRSCGDANVQEIKGWLPYKLLTPSADGFGPCIGGDGSDRSLHVEIGLKQRAQYMQPEEIIALMLASTVHAAEEQLGRNIEHILVSVPANYGYRQRQAVIDSFRIASAEPTVRIDRSGRMASEKPDFSQLKVKELKKLLSERDIECSGCSSKYEFVSMLDEAWTPLGAPELVLLRLINSNNAATYTVRDMLRDRDGDGDIDVVVFSAGESTSLISLKANDEDAVLEMQAIAAIEAPDLTLRLNDHLMDYFDSTHCKKGCHTSKELQKRKIQGKSFSAGAAKDCCIRNAPKAVKLKLREAVESAEAQLTGGSPANSVDVHLDGVHAGHNLGPLTIEKKKLDRQLLIDALRTTSGMLKKLGLSLKDVDEFLVIGEHEMLGQLHEELEWTSEDSAASQANFRAVDLPSLVASGAAAIGAALSGMTGRSNFVSVLEVSSASYTRDGNDEPYSRRWTLLPHTGREMSLVIPESMIKTGKVGVSIYENSRGEATNKIADCGANMQKCNFVGEFVACGLPRRKGSEHVMTVRFSTSREGLLSGEVTKYEIDDHDHQQPRGELILDGKCKRIDPAKSRKG